MKTILKIALPLCMFVQVSGVFTQGASDSEMLLKDLQASYAKLQTALSDTNLSGFIDAKVPHKDMALVTEPQFKESIQALKWMYPILNAKDFLEVKRSGDIAGYYYLSDEDGIKFITVKLIKFKKIKDGWKVGDVGSSSEPLKSNDNIKARIRKMIDSSETLKLEE